MSEKLKNNIYVCLASGIAVLFLLLPLATDATDYRSPEVRVFNNEGTNVGNFLAFAQNFNGGMSVAVCDLDNNGYEEIIVGPGPGGGPQVRILNSHGQPKFTPGFFAYDEIFRGGINVACGDLDNDGFPEIVTAPQSSGGPHIRIFDRYGQPKFTPGFFAYNESMKGGVNIAVGDIDGGGINEILTAPARGEEPIVNVFNRYGNKLDFEIYPFHPEFSGGVSLATADIDGDNTDELVMGVFSQDSSLIKVMRANESKQIIGEFYAFPKEFTGGIVVSRIDLDNDGIDEIMATANSGGGPHIRFFHANGDLIQKSIFSFENEFRGGSSIASGDIDNDGLEEIIAVPRKKQYQGNVNKIVVDLSEQRLYAYEDNLLLKSFLVSTGLPGMDTQAGTFMISQKIYSKLYSGPDYYLPNTLWNMRFDGPRLLHGAYWHNNFGHRMSHGCVNISYPDAEWLYNASPVGTRVIVNQ